MAMRKAKSSTRNRFTPDYWVVMTKPQWQSLHESHLIDAYNSGDTNLVQYIQKKETYNKYLEYHRALNPVGNEKRNYPPEWKSHYPSQNRPVGIGI